MHADWIELCALFAKHGVRYLIIGGNAVAFHGYERFTKDIDFWVRPDPRNARGVYNAAREFGALASSVKKSDFENPDAFVVMGAEPYRVDILMGPPGLDFDQAYANRVVCKRDAVELSYVSVDDLLTLKRAAGRPIDLRDIEMLEAGKKLLSEKKAT